MTYSTQNAGRLPIIDQSCLVTYSVDENVFGDGEDAIENGALGFYVVERSHIDGETYIWPNIYPTAEAAHAALFEAFA